MDCRRETLIPNSHLLDGSVEISVRVCRLTVEVILQAWKRGGEKKRRRKRPLAHVVSFAQVDHEALSEDRNDDSVHSVLDFTDDAMKAYKYAYVSRALGRDIH